ncbi:MAG: hypothetical protein V3U03_17205 [Myxococcota bacterium]
MGRHHLVVVPHTHWDREWYGTHEQFRYRLVQLLDRLLDLLERDSAYAHFTLDGQVVVLEDYFEVRPAARERVAVLVRTGRLLIGPWFVLPDEWLVSGEALIRNLRLGLDIATALGGSMRLGYVPDQFGHVGQLPQIFAGFGFDSAVLWRGVGDDVDETLFEWEAPDGTRLFAVYLLRGYGNAANLPLQRDALERRLGAEIRALEGRSRIQSLLLMNGSDHLEPQADLPAALEAAAAGIGVSFEIGDLPGFVSRARAEVEGELTVHRGEFRSGLRAPLLPGCASARAPQKRADFENDRLLTRYLEPLAAWLEALGGDPDPAVIQLAWRTALLNHPHDSICGCSIDAVHEHMESRFRRVAELAGSHLARVARELGGRVELPDDGPGEGLVVWNPNAGGFAQAEGELELDVPLRRRGPLALHLRGDGGRRIPVHAELVEPGAILAQYSLPASAVAVLVEGFPREFTGQFVRAVRLRRRRGAAHPDESAAPALQVELLLGEQPAADFDLDAAKAELLRELEASDGPATFRVRRLPRVRVRFADDLPGHGVRAYRVAKGRGARAAADLVAQRSPDGGALIANETWRVEVASDGRVGCWHAPTGRAVADALRLVSDGDRGDAYNFDPVPGGERLDRPERVRVRLGPRSGAEVSAVVNARYRVPAELSADRASRSSRRVWLPVRVTLRLAAGLDRLDVSVEAHNTARDHRFRVELAAPFAASRFEVESAFEIVDRPIAPAADAFGAERPAEFPIGATPQRSFSTLIGDRCAMTVANRGCPEVEALPQPGGTTALALTVLRAVGWLSRDDLALRPGHAGPAIRTPGGQVPGAHRVELSWRLHAPDDPFRLAEAHRFAWPAWAFAGGCSTPAPLADRARLLELEDPAVVVSAVEPRPGSPPVVRLFNASSQARRVQLRWNGPGASRLEAVDLAGRAAPLPGLEAGGDGAVQVPLRAWQLVGLRPR